MASFPITIISNKGWSRFSPATKLRSTPSDEIYICPGRVGNWIFEKANYQHKNLKIWVFIPTKVATNSLFHTLITHWINKPFNPKKSSSQLCVQACVDTSWYKARDNFDNWRYSRSVCWWKVRSWIDHKRSFLGGSWWCGHTEANIVDTWPCCQLLYGLQHTVLVRKTETSL